MNKILLTLTTLVSLLSSLCAANPTTYSALGDLIYDNVKRIEALQTIEECAPYYEDIALYVKEVAKTKKIGMEIEHSELARDRSKEYLQRLRKLSKEHDSYLRSADSLYRRSLDEQNVELFLKIINSGLIDTQTRKDEILEFYFKNIEDMNTTGVIQKYLNEDAKLQKMSDTHLLEQRIKKREQERRIQRVREQDIEAHRELEQRLKEEVQRKKSKIDKMKTEEFNH